MSLKDQLPVRKAPYHAWRSELEKSTEGNFLSKIFKSSGIKKEVALLGQALLTKLEDTKYDDPIFYDNNKSIVNLIYNHFSNDKIWEDREYYKLLEFFWGDKIAKRVKKAWPLIPKMIYQHGYYRRSFRAPNNLRFTNELRLKVFRSFLTIPGEYNYLANNNTYFDISFEDEIRYSNEIVPAPYKHLLWTAAIDNEGDEIFSLIENIIYNKDAVGKVSRSIIKALSNSDNPKSWRLLEQLLLAAQRQEGLRQTILESLDETNINAFKYLINTIIENNLTRFTSVVRAFDTWTGLGWSGEKESTVKDALKFAKNLFDAEDSIYDVVSTTKHNGELFMALWVTALKDVEATAPLISQIIRRGDKQLLISALAFLNQTNHPMLEMGFYYNLLKEQDLQVLSFVLPRTNALLDANKESGYFIKNENFSEFFERLHNLSLSIPVKQKEFNNNPFSWMNSTFTKDNIYASMFALVGSDTRKLNIVLENFEAYNITLRESLARNILGKLYAYYYNSNYNDVDQPNPTPFQRAFALRIIHDKGQSLKSSALNVLGRNHLNDEEVDTLANLLKSKNTELRKNILHLLFKQKIVSKERVLNQLAASSDIMQRVAATELIKNFEQQNVRSKKLEEWKEILAADENLNKYLTGDIKAKTGNEPTLKNGFHIYNPEKISPYKLPKIEKGGLYYTAKNSSNRGLSFSKKEVIDKLNNLKNIYLEHIHHEYEIESWDNSKEKVILGNRFQGIKYNNEGLSLLEKFQNYPLYEIWDQWYIQSELKPIDLYFLTNCHFYQKRNFVLKHIMQFLPFSEEDIPNPQVKRSPYNWGNPLSTILQILTYKYPFEQKIDFIIDLVTDIYSKLPDSILKWKEEKKQGYYYVGKNGDGWQSISELSFWLTDNDFLNLDASQLEKCWNIFRWRQYSGLKENIEMSHPSLLLYSFAYKNNFITKDEMYQGILSIENLRFLTDRKSSRYKDYVKNFDFIEEMVDELRNALLNIEMLRGDASTEVTSFVHSINELYGVNRFVQLLNGLKKSKLFKGYIYSYSTDTNKQKIFSYLLKRCYPLTTDTQELFNASIEENKFSEKQLIESVIYAPQWQKFIRSYFNWPGLDQAIWWMHAHTKTPAYQTMGAELESEIAHYSLLEVQDFKNGAVDKDWFNQAFAHLGEEKWNLLYDAAKYITDGNGHRRVKLYADALTGHLSNEDVYEKISAKRDQDYLRVYGLMPLNKDDKEKDILERYLFLQKFKKESRQFGSMRQSSESLAVQVAIENLSRNAGYQDPQRLIWDMEVLQAEEIFANETSFGIDDLNIRLQVEDDGKTEIVAIDSNGKIKAVPAKYKKNERVVALTGFRKILNEQYKRAKKSLEDAMVNREMFTAKELTTLTNHPVISKLLAHLVFVVDDGNIGFIKSLRDAGGLSLNISEGNNYRIAHCVDLHGTKKWAAFQSYCFENKLKQPFKQIFRELYLPTADELAEKSISRRYAGHQVQPKQTLALLKTRQWKVDYEEGLQKAFLKEGFISKIYARADWFSPSDIESPTIETVEFHNLKDYSNVAFESIHPIIFSEVMRDVDLVVSVAHAGGVDPEASHSTIEMRKAILRETARLFKLKNIEFLGNHLKITGKMATYTVHIGSAVVHQLPGNYLSVLPVHSQHRGRIFLPFIDDDPKSAEVVSKMLLLSEDHKIQDPTILSQIERQN